MVWWYPNPTQESASVRGMLCFYPDKVTTFVDGKEIAKIGMPNLKEITGKDTNGQQQNGGQKHEHNAADDKGYGKSCNC